MLTASILPIIAGTFLERQSRKYVLQLGVGIMQISMPRLAMICLVFLILRSILLSKCSLEISIG